MGTVTRDREASLDKGNGPTGFDVESEVQRRYGAGAETAEPGLCCPTDYDPQYLAMLPAEVLEKDYGCGDPSAYVNEGETVLDLGSGAGKICFVLSQKVGASGSVIGVDFNDSMLAVARKYVPEMADKLGYGNVRFLKAKIQDLALSLDAMQAWLDAHPVVSVEDLTAYESECDRLRRESPLIPDDSIDVVVSNCVLNLVRPQDKAKLFKEMHRVLRRGGRAVISDVVCDETPTPSILADEKLWSDCIAGAFREDRFLEMFEEAGFYGITILKRQEKPWQVIEGIEFRSMTVQAFKGKEGPCLERHQAVTYCGPWKSVTDDDGHTLHRGRRMAVCDKTLRLYTDAAGPYGRDVIPILPREEVSLEDAVLFDCSGDGFRHPRETKGLDYDETTTPPFGSCCGPDRDCC